MGYALARVPLTPDTHAVATLALALGTRFSAGRIGDDFRRALLGGFPILRLRHSVHNACSHPTALAA